MQRNSNDKRMSAFQEVPRDTGDKRRRYFEQMISGLKEMNSSRKGKKHQNRNNPQYKYTPPNRLPPNPFDVTCESDIPTGYVVHSTETSTTTHSSSTGARTVSSNQQYQQYQQIQQTKQPVQTNQLNQFNQNNQFNQMNNFNNNFNQNNNYY